VVAVLLPQQIMKPSLTSEELSIFRTNEIRTASLDRSLHILVIGTDAFDATHQPETWSESLQGRSDVLLLTRFDPADQKLTILSIPRDTRVKIPEHGTQKINAANAIGGPALTAQVVSTLLGDVPIDRYIRLNTDGIKALIDAVGGVEVYVPERMKYTDVTQKLYIDLQPGWQRLNGDQAHQFIRFRHDQLGDIGRVQRQQELLRAISKELLKPETWSRAPLIMDAIRQNVDTNLTWEEVLGLAKFMLSSGDDHLDMVMLPGRFSQSREYASSYWIPDLTGIYEVAVNHFEAIPRNGEVQPTPPSQLRIAVQNASGRADMAKRLVQDLRRKGFVNVFAIEDYSRVLPKTAIIAQQGDHHGAQEVQALLGVGEARVESTGALDSDITIKLGLDWVNFWYPEEADLANEL
jgi:LCP family protein required for cell wall assembly